jgi:hypothetical protein
MVLIKKKAKARGRVDTVFADGLNAPPSPTTLSGLEPSTKEGKEKWWNLTSWRKDTAPGVAKEKGRGAGVKLLLVSVLYKTLNTPLSSPRPRLVSPAYTHGGSDPHHHAGPDLYTRVAVVHPQRARLYARYD